MRDDRFEVVISDKSPELLIITPLRKDDKIQSDCKDSIVSQNINKVWVSFQSKKSASYNRIEGYKKVKSFLRKNLPPYILFCDGDIVWAINSFSKMIDTLKQTEDDIGYCYCNFEYKGFRNFKFPARPFDSKLLVQRNYISTMSIQKMSHWKKYGRLDLNLDRYQDWDLWLSYLLNYSIIGIPCFSAHFYAISTEKDISMRPDENFKNLKKLIKKYKLPILLGED